MKKVKMLREMKIVKIIGEIMIVRKYSNKIEPLTTETPLDPKTIKYLYTEVPQETKKLKK